MDNQKSKIPSNPTTQWSRPLSPPCSYSSRLSTCGPLQYICKNMRSIWASDMENTCWSSQSSRSNYPTLSAIYLPSKNKSPALLRPYINQSKDISCLLLKNKLFSDSVFKETSCSTQVYILSYVAMVYLHSFTASKKIIICNCNP